MIRGVGLDLCSVGRMARALETLRFCDRVFSPEEIAYAREKAVPARHFAAAFAAREAFAKAGGWGLGRVGFCGVRLLRQKNGAPCLEMGEGALLLMREIGAVRALVSVSHEGDMAAAVVVLEG